MRAFVLIFLILPIFAQASPDESALIPSIYITPDVKPEMQQKVAQDVESAFHFINYFRPPGYDHHLFDWKNNRATLAGKSLTVVAVNSGSQLIASFMKDPVNAESEAFTTATADKVAGTMNIVMFLLVDRLLHDGTPFERPDSFANLIVALVHEVFGNVQTLLEMDVHRAEPMTIASQKEQARLASQVTVLFLESLRNHKMFPSLPPKLSRDLMELLPREIEHLRRWQKENPDAKLDPMCAALLEGNANQTLH